MNFDFSLCSHVGTLLLGQIVFCGPTFSQREAKCSVWELTDQLLELVVLSVTTRCD